MRMDNPSLLILACSARKHHLPGKVRAWDLYDGVMYRVVKKLERESKMPRNVDILILSAQYGLLMPDDMIEMYDRRMDKKRAHELQENCQAWMRNWLSGKAYTEVYLSMGRTYQLALQPFNTWLPDGAKLIIPSGGIGLMLQQLKEWLLLHGSAGLGVKSPCQRR